MGLATTTLRIGLGGLLAGHGLQKLAGKFGGPGLDGAAAGFEQMGMSPGKPYATAAALTETIGGGLLATGLFTPLGAAMVTGTMAVAIGKVHGKNGLWITEGGMEYNLMLIGAAFAVTEHGPGFPALDGLIAKRRKGLGWALAELAVGLAGGAAVIALSNRGASGVAGVADKVSDLADSVSEKANQAADAVSEKASDVADKASDAADTVADKASDAADSTASASSTIAGKASDAASKAATATDKAGDAAPSLPESAGKAASNADNGAQS